MDGSHRLKLDRAVFHLQTLHEAAQRWAQTDPCAVVEDCEVETRKHRVFVDVVHQPDDPLIALTMADCIHNMRQALDHLAYDLAVALQGTDPPPNKDNAGFPISTTATHFQNAVYGKIAPKKRMPKALYAALKATQPHPGQDQALWTLHELDNLDKHRFLPVVAGVVRGESFYIGTFTGSHFSGPRLGALEPHTPVVEYIPDPETEVDMNFQFAGAIAFSKASTVAPGVLVIDLLSAINTFIADKVFG